MNIYEVVYDYHDPDGFISSSLRKIYPICNDYDEVTRILEHREIKLVQSITYLGRVFNSEVLKE